MTPVEALAEVWESLDKDDELYELLTKYPKNGAYGPLATAMESRLRKRGFDVVSVWQPINEAPDDCEEEILVWITKSDELGYVPHAEIGMCAGSGPEPVDMTGPWADGAEPTHFKFIHAPDVSVGEKA